MFVKPSSAFVGWPSEVASRVAMMDDGRIVEEGSPERLFLRPAQERTRAFLAKIL